MTLIAPSDRHPQSLRHLSKVMDLRSAGSTRANTASMTEMAPNYEAYLNVRIR
jgi:hypothetical protein